MRGSRGWRWRATRYEWPAGWAMRCWAPPPTPILRWSPETVLRVPDPAALSGLLHRLQQHGLEIATKVIQGKSGPPRVVTAHFW